MKFLFIIFISVFLFCCNSKPITPPTKDEALNELYDLIYPKDFLRTSILSDVYNLKVEILNVEKKDITKEVFQVLAVAKGTFIRFEEPSKNFVDSIHFELIKERKGWTKKNIRQSFQYSIDYDRRTAIPDTSFVWK